MDKAEEQKKTKKLIKKVSFAEVDIIHGSDSDDSNELSEQSYQIDDRREEVSTDTCDSDSDEITDYGITACSSDDYDNILAEPDSESESESDSGVMDTPESMNNNGSPVCEGEPPTVVPGVSSDQVDNANLIATSGSPDTSTSNTVDISSSDLLNRNELCRHDNSLVEKGSDDADVISSVSDMETSYESSVRGEVSAMEISFVSETTELVGEQTIEITSQEKSEADDVDVDVGDTLRDSGESELVVESAESVTSSDGVAEPRSAEEQASVHDTEAAAAEISEPDVNVNDSLSSAPLATEVSVTSGEVASNVDEAKSDEPKAVCSDSDVIRPEPCPEDSVTLDGKALLEDTALGLAADEPADEGNNTYGQEVTTTTGVVDETNDNFSETQIDGNKDTSETVVADASPIVERDAPVVTPDVSACDNDIGTMSPTRGENDDNESSDVPMDNDQVDDFVPVSEEAALPLESDSPSQGDIAVNEPVEVGDDIDSAPVFDTISNEINEAPVNEANAVDGSADDVTNTIERQDANVTNLDSDLNGDGSAAPVTFTEEPAEDSVLGVAPCSQVANDADIEKSESIDQSPVEDKETRGEDEGIDSDGDLMKETITKVNVAPIENIDESNEFEAGNTEIESCSDELSQAPIREMGESGDFQAVRTPPEMNATEEDSAQGIDNASDTKYIQETQTDIAIDTTDMVVETEDLLPADEISQVEISAGLEATQVALVESGDTSDTCNAGVVEESNTVLAEDHEMDANIVREQTIITNQTETSVEHDNSITTTVTTTEIHTTVVGVEAMLNGTDSALDSAKVNSNVVLNETDSVADATKSDSELEVVMEESKLASCDETDPVGVNTESMSAPAGESSISGTDEQIATDIVVSNADVVDSDVGQHAVEREDLVDQPASEEPTTIDETAVHEVVDDVAESLLTSNLVTSDTAVCGTDGNTGDEIAELVDSDDHDTVDLEIPVAGEKEELQQAGGMVETVSTDDVDVEAGDIVISNSLVMEDKLTSEVKDESDKRDALPDDTLVDNAQEGLRDFEIKQGDVSEVELATTIQDNESSVPLDLNVNTEQESTDKDVDGEHKATDDMVLADVETDRVENRPLGDNEEPQDKVDTSDISNIAESDDVINCVAINRESEASVLPADIAEELSDKNAEMDFHEEIGPSVDMDASIVRHETDTIAHVEMKDEILSDTGAIESNFVPGEKDGVPEMAVEDSIRASDVPDTEDMSQHGDTGEKMDVKQDAVVKDTAEKPEESGSVSEIVTVSSEKTLASVPSQEAMGVQDSELPELTAGSDSVVDTEVVCEPNTGEIGDGRSPADATIGILSTEDRNLEKDVVEPSSELTPTNELQEASKDTQVWHGNPINGPGPCHSNLASSPDRYTVIDHGEVIHEGGSDGEESSDICYGTGTGTSTQSRFQDTSAVLFAQASSAYEFEICPTKIPDDDDTVCSDNTPREETVLFPSSEPPVVVENVIEPEPAPKEEEIPNFVAVVDKNDIGQSHAEVSRSEPIRIETGKAPDNKVDELHKLTIEITRSAELEPGASKLFDTSPLSELEDEDLELLERASNRASFVGSLDDLSPIDEAHTKASETLDTSDKDVGKDSKDTNGEGKVDEDYPDVDLSESVGLEYFTGGSSWSEYFQHFEAFCRAKKWPRPVKASYLFAHLKGRAKQVACKLSAENQRDFDQLVATLGRFFTARDEAELYLFELRNRVRKPEEGLRDLGNDVKRLTNLAYPEIPVNQRIPLARIHFMDALKNNAMLKHIYQGRPDTVEDAIKLAIEYEGFKRVAEVSEVLKPRPKSIEEVVNGGDRSEMEKRLAELAKSIGEIKSTLGNANKSSAPRDIS